MNPKLGIYFALACIVVALGAYGCHTNATPTVTASPTPTGTGPDTLYVQSSNEVRVYQHVSTANGSIIASAVLPTSDISNPDVVYSPAFNVLWYPSAYPGQTGGPPMSTPVKIWTNAIGQSGKNPSCQLAYTNGQGTATYDATHDLLFVANVNGPTIQVYAKAGAMNCSSTSQANITLTITDPGIVGTPRPAELLYDPVNDRLFASDQGAVVASFDGFGAAANAAVVGHTNPTISASRELTGLIQPYGLAYSAPNDVLYISEKRPSVPGDIDVIHNASTSSGNVAHSQVVTGFSSGPEGMAYDPLRDLLFIYDPIVIWVLPHPATASGNVNGITNRRQILDANSELFGFGIAVDTTH